MKRHNFRDREVRTMLIEKYKKWQQEKKKHIFRGYDHHTNELTVQRFIKMHIVFYFTVVLPS